MRYIDWEEVFLKILMGLIIVVCLALPVALVVDWTQHYTKSEQVTIEVENKDTDIRYWTTYVKSGKVNVPIQHSEKEYFIYWEDKKVEVSSAVYQNTNIGDRLIVNKVYKIKKDTEEIVEIYYEYAGN